MNSSKEKSLLKNTAFLYILTFSNYLFSLITLPYETRVLGPEYFGILGFAAAFYSYFYIIFDFGFILCGTKKITENINNHNALERIVSGITFAKILLFLITAVIFSIVCFSVNQLKEYFVILFLYLIYAALTCLIPDYLYRGLENMKMITYRTLLVRFIFTCLIFVFLKQPEQVYLIPLFNIIGSICALGWVYYDIKHHLHISIRRVPLTYIWFLISESFVYFISRIASTIYGATNMVILGFLYPAGNILGYFTSVDKIRGLASQAASPIADSFYPYMLRTKDYRKMFRISFIMELIMLVGCVFLWIFAKEFCTIVFGSDYENAGEILRYILPLMALILPNYMLGFPSLSPIGMAKWANHSVVIAMINQIIGIIILFSLNKISVYSIILVTITSELLCLLVRVVVFVKVFKSYKHV